MSHGEILFRAAAGSGHTTLTSGFPMLSPLVQLLLCVIYSSTQPSKPVPGIREEESPCSGCLMAVLAPSLDSECPRSSGSAFAALALKLVGAVVTWSCGIEGWM